MFTINNYAQIALPENPSAQEVFAAQLIQKDVQKFYHKDLKIFHKNTPVSNSICVGNFSKDLDIITDNVNIEFKNSNVYIFGKENRDLLYSTYTFLEKFLGIYQFTPTYKTLVSQKTKKTNYHYSPPFIYRRDFSYESNFSKEFNSVLREDSDFPADSVFGKPYNIFGFVHTFANILPASKYFKSHPDWFLNTDQIKKLKPDFTDQEVQINFTNEAAFAEVIKNLSEIIENNPAEKVFSVSMNDGGEFYECKDCRINSENKSTQLLRFVNKVAKEIAKKYPNVFIETLFYADAIDLPSIKPERNVILRLALINNEIGHTLQNPMNAKKLDLINSWASFTKNLFYWDYALNSYVSGFLMPQPGFRRLGSDLQYFKKIGLKGYFVQSYLGNNELAYFSEMKSWVLSRLIWDPSQNEDRLIQFYFKNNYGAAGENMYQIYNAVEDASEKYPLETYHENYNFIDEVLIEKCKNLFSDSYKKVAGDLVLTKKIDRQKLFFDFAELYLFKQLNLQKRFAGKTSNDVQSFSSQRNTFLADLQKIDLKPETVAKVSKIVSDLVVPDFANEAIKSDSKSIIIQENEFQLYPDKSIAGIEEDNGKNVAYLNGNNLLWGIIVYFKNYVSVLKDEKWEINAKIRLKIKVKKENILLNVGVYNFETGTNKLVKRVPIEKFVNNEYQFLTLPAMKLSEKDELWFYVDGNCNCIDQLLVDYIELKPKNK